MTSPFSLPFRLSSPPAIEDLTEVYDNSFSENEVSEAVGVDSQVSLPQLTSQPQNSQPQDSQAQDSQLQDSHPQDNANSRRIWDGAAGRAWFDEVIHVRNTYQLYNLPWSHRHWKEVSRRLGERGFDRRWKVIKSYYNNMKAKWNDRCFLLEQSGFGIDGEGKVSVAESVWNKFVEVSIYHNISLYYILTCVSRNLAAGKGPTLVGIENILFRTSSWQKNSLLIRTGRQGRPQMMWKISRKPRLSTCLAPKMISNCLETMEMKGRMPPMLTKVRVVVSPAVNVP